MGCPPNQTLRSRKYQSPLVSFTTVYSGPQAQGDVPLNAPFPARTSFVVSRLAAHVNDSLYLHFNPLNKSYGGLGITPNGTEQWLPLGIGIYGTAATILRGYSFKEPMPINLFLDIGYEAGGGGTSPITFAFSNDVFWWQLLQP